MYQNTEKNTEKITEKIQKIFAVFFLQIFPYFFLYFFFKIEIKRSHNQFFLIFEQDMAQIIETNS